MSPTATTTATEGLALMARKGVPQALKNHSIRAYPFEWSAHALILVMH